MTILSHYTSFEGLHGIVRSQSMWATEFSALNDTSELMYAFAKIIDRTFFRLAAELRPKLGDEKVQALVSKKEELTKAFVEQMHTTIAASDGYGSVFTTSFARGRNADEDDRGILTLWEKYTEHQGYCLQFQKSTIERLLKNELQRYSYQCLKLVDVTYGVDESAPEFLALVDEVLWHVQVFVTRGFAGDNLGPSFDPRIAANLLAIQLLEYCASHKDPQFCDEREVRLIAVPHDKALSAFMTGVRIPKKIIDRGTQQQPRRYLSIFGDSLPGLRIDRIIVGHKVSATDQSLLASLFPPLPKIALSRIPLRK